MPRAMQGTVHPLGDCDWKMRPTLHMLMWGVSQTFFSLSTVKQDKKKSDHKHFFFNFGRFLV